MSWIPFRGGSSNSKSSKSGKADNSSSRYDSQFNDQVEKLTRVENNSRKVYKDMKRLIEDNNSLVKVETRLADDFLTHAAHVLDDDDVNDDDVADTTATSLKESLERQSELRTTLNENLQKCFVDPMKKFTQHYNSVNSAMIRREFFVHLLRNKVHSCVKVLHSCALFLKAYSKPFSLI